MSRSSLVAVLQSEESRMIRRCLLAAILFVGASALAYSKSPADWLEPNLPSIVELYQHLHSHPELSYKEKETSARLAKELRDAGAEVTEGVGGYGVVGLLKNGDGPVVMLRADMDALPVAEETGLPYASTVRTEDERGATVGVMHACGHDIHMANLIGVARYLAATRDQWRGTVLFICQPAEERGAGAKAMLDDGLFVRFPRPDYAVALHVSPIHATGKVAYRAGYAMANVDSVDITIHGRGGHGAYPHTTIDPIVIAARLVLDLQTIVSREMKPIDPAVVTVGSIRGGTKHNITPAECQLQLTVRSYAPEVRKQIHDAIRRKAIASAQSSGAPEPDVKISEGTPSLFNDEKLVARLVPVFQRVLGEENVVEAEPVMGGEDFSQYGLAGVPVMMFSLGSINEERLKAYTAQHGPLSLHAPIYYPDYEPTLTTGITALASAALELLDKP
jgi:hippurate hydrolase